MKKSLEQRIAAVVREHVAIVPYDPEWPRMFSDESDHLLDILPSPIIKRVEHFGSTAVPGLPAKPIIDILVEVSSLEEIKTDVVPSLEAEGYDYFWRPTIEDDSPFYVWFIKRDANGNRTHHVHMVEADSQLWERLYFVEYLKEFPEEAESYARLKREISTSFLNDRVAYTKSKTDFIVSLTRKAVAYYARRRRPTSE